MNQTFRKSDRRWSVQWEFHIFRIFFSYFDKFFLFGHRVLFFGDKIRFCYFWKLTTTHPNNNLQCRADIKQGYVLSFNELWYSLDVSDGFKAISLISTFRQHLRGGFPTIWEEETTRRARSPTRKCTDIYLISYSDDILKSGIAIWKWWTVNWSDILHLFPNKSVTILFTSWMRDIADTRINKNMSSSAGSNLGQR